MPKRNTIDGLSEMQRLFAREYCVDLNATQAAIRAGYSERSAYQIGYDNSHNPKVQTAIAKEMEARGKALGIKQEWVVEQFLEVYRRCKQIEAVKNEQGETIGEYKFEHAGANRALEMIGKHLGMFSEKFAKELVAGMSDEELLAKTKEILRKHEPTENGEE